MAGQERERPSERMDPFYSPFEARAAFRLVLGGRREREQRDQQALGEGPLKALPGHRWLSSSRPEHCLRSRSSARSALHYLTRGGR